MQELGVLRGARAPFSAARSSYAGRALSLAVDRPALSQRRRPGLRCTAVAEVESEVEKRGEPQGPSTCQGADESPPGPLSATDRMPEDVPTRTSAESVVQAVRAG